MMKPCDSGCGKPVLTSVPVPDCGPCDEAESELVSPSDGILRGRLKSSESLSQLDNLLTSLSPSQVELIQLINRHPALNRPLHAYLLINQTKQFISALIYEKLIWSPKVNVFHYPESKTALRKSDQPKRLLASAAYSKGARHLLFCYTVWAVFLYGKEFWVV